MAGRPSRAQVYDRLDQAVAELSDRMGGLPDPVEAEDIWTTIWYQEAHHSTAIEGNTLVLKQVEQLLAARARGVGPHVVGRVDEVQRPVVVGAHKVGAEADAWVTFGDEAVVRPLGPRCAKGAQPAGDGLAVGVGMVGLLVGRRGVFR